MANTIVFNPFTGNFDFVGGGSQSNYFHDPVQHETDLPVPALDGTLCVVQDTDHIYIFNLGSNKWLDTGLTQASTVGSSPSAAGYTTDTTTSGSVIHQTITLQPADGTHPGIVTSGTQTLGGSKTFPATIVASGGVDASGTLGLGTTTATAINIGHSGITVNIQGTTLYENVTQLQVTDPLITINKGGGTGSGANSGIEIEENSVITGYAETSSDRNSWALKAPGTAGIATITPGASGITLNQSSHNPVTLGTANGLSLSTQQLSLQAATDSVPGALTAADHAYFNAKVDSVNGKTGNSVTLTTSDITEGSNLYYTDERAQDAVGNALTNTTNIAFTYNDGANTISADLTTTGVTANTYGDATHTAQITVDNKGRISSASSVAVNGASALDIGDTTFSGSATGSAANVTGFSFANASVRSFEAQVQVVSNSLYEEFTLKGVQRGADWMMNQSSTGDNSATVFSITSAGQIQYIASNSVVIHFRARALAV